MLDLGNLLSSSLLLSSPLLPIPELGGVGLILTVVIRIVIIIIGIVIIIIGFIMIIIGIIIIII